MKIMKQPLALAWREFVSLWVTPMGYGVAALFMLGSSLLFFAEFSTGAEATMLPVYIGVSWLLAVLTPAVSMRLLSEEWRSGTLELLTASPVTDTQIVVGKWLGAMGFVGLMLGLLWPACGVLMVWGRPDVGVLISGWMGLWLVAGLYLGIGLWVSAMTSSGLLCYMASLFVIGAVTLLTALLPFAAFVGPDMRVALFTMNVPAQFGDFAQGVIDPTTVCFFVSGILLMLFIAIQSLRFRRQVSGRTWEPVASSAIAVVVVVLLNIIVANETTRLMRVLPYAWQGWVRVDVTADNAQSLSPRTLRNLDQLDSPVQIVSTLGDLDAATRPVHDRLNLLARSSGHITVSHLRATDTRAITELRQAVQDRFQVANAPAVETLNQVEAALRPMADQMAKIAAKLNTRLDEDREMIMRTRQAIALSVDAISKTSRQISDQVEAFENSRVDDLPDYAAQLQQYQRILDALRRAVLPRFIEQMEQVVSDDKATGATREQAILLADQAEAMREQVGDWIAAISAVEFDASYQRMREALGSGAVVLVLGDGAGQAEAVNLVSSETGAWQVSEDALAAAIGRVSGSKTTLGQVVFVSIDGQPVVSEGGPMRYWASRLATAGFRVRQQTLEQLIEQIEGEQMSEWDRAVYVLPAILPGSLNPESMRLARNQKALALKTILDQGGSVIALTMPDPTLRAVETDRLLGVLASHGITPKADHVLVWLRPLGENRSAISTQMVVTDFSDHSPITRGLDGSPAMVAGASPLEIQDNAKGVEVTSLVEVRDPRVWATGQMAQLAAASQAGEALEPGTYAGPYVVAALSRDTEDSANASGGLVVISSGLFGHDLITSNADPALNPQGIGSAASSGAAYPANLELLINSIYVLTGEATFATAGEGILSVRRIGLVGSSRMFVLRLLLMVIGPGLIIAVGVAVWFIRRRG